MAAPRASPPGAAEPDNNQTVTKVELYDADGTLIAESKPDPYQPSPGDVAPLTDYPSLYTNPI